MDVRNTRLSLRLQDVRRSGAQVKFDAGSWRRRRTDKEGAQMFVRSVIGD